MNKKKKIILFMLIILNGMIILGGCGMSKQYVNNYYEEMGRPLHRLPYDEAIEYWGEPKEVNKKIENGFAYMDAYYDDIILHFINYIESSDIEKEYEELYYMDVISDKYEFGRKNIKVGSTKEEVIKAYKNINKIREAELGEAYVDGIAYIYFIYDENDIVTRIRISPTGL